MTRPISAMYRSTAAGMASTFRLQASRHWKKMSGFTVVPRVAGCSGFREWARKAFSASISTRGRRSS